MKYELHMSNEDEARRTYSVRLLPSVIKRLRHLAVEEERTLSDLIEKAIEDLLAKGGGMPPEDEGGGLKKRIRRSK